jgi:hypothetical protein
MALPRFPRSEPDKKADPPKSNIKEEKKKDTPKKKKAKRSWGK